LVVTSEEFARRRGLEPLATIVARAYVAGEFAYLARMPATAGKEALEKAGKAIGDVERVELNEAFSSVVLNSAKMLDVDPERVNVNGGAVARSPRSCSPQRPSPAGPRPASPRAPKGSGCLKGRFAM